MEQEATEILDGSPPSEAEPETGATEAVIPEPLDLGGLTEKQYEAWRLTGKVPEKSGTPETPDAAGDPEGSEETPPAGDDKTQQQQAQPKGGKKETAEQRIKNLLAKNKQLQADLDRAKNGTQPGEKPAESPTAKPTEPKTSKLEAPVKPRFEDFKDKSYEEFEAAKDAYFEALTDYKAAKAIEADRAERVKEAREAEAAKTQKQIEQSWTERMAQAVKDYPDYGDVVFADGNLRADIPHSSAMDEYILDSEVGPAILYHLAKNLDETRRIAGLNPIRAAAALRDMEVAITGERPAKVTPITGAPKPKITNAGPIPTTVSGRGAPPSDVVEAALKAGDFATYQREQNARELRTRKQG